MVSKMFWMQLVLLCRFFIFFLKNILHVSGIGLMIFHMQNIL